MLSKLKKGLDYLKSDPAAPLIFLSILFGIFTFFILDEPLWAHYIWFATLILGGLPIVYHTVKGMLKGQFASDIVALLAIITAIFLSQAFAGAVVVLMQSGGEALERFGLRKASRSLDELLKRAPKKARRKTNSDSFEEIDVKEVNIEDILLVRPGEMIPVDGTITQGKTQIDDSAITGEPLAKEKGEGGELLSGSINVTGAIEMKALKKSEESQYAQIVKLVQKAEEEKAPIQRLADRYAIFFTPLTLFMALVGYLVTNEFVTVLSVLVVATPCPLILATPLAIICGINRSAKEGIIVKGGAPLEQIASTEALFFDKTGTLTKGTPSIEKVIALQGKSEEEVLQIAASIEQFSTHSIAKSILEKAKEKNLSLLEAKDFVEVPGESVSAKISGGNYTISSYKGDENLEVQKELKQGAIAVSISSQEKRIGLILMKDALRENVKDTILSLQKMGVKKIMMLTGDTKKTAEYIAKEASITDVASELKPDQKVEIIKQNEKEFKVLTMVGDGINDAPALATATVGIAMGERGAAISAEAADIVILVDDLNKVTTSLKIGKRTLKIAKESIFIGIGLSFLLMVIACTGRIVPAVGALLQEVIDVSVILNALRVLKK